MVIEVEQAVSSVKPTMTDQEVLEFCKRGLLILEGVIPDSTNRWVLDYLNQDERSQPKDLLTEARFVDEVLLHPAVTGAARSLLGANYQLPEKISNHRLVGPKDARSWHIDSGSKFERSCDLLQIFYIPQANSLEMGPTLFLPGSHLVPVPREELEHFGHLAGQVATVATAGSVFFTAYSIWHKQPKKTDQSVRNLLKWQFWRTLPPQRDWLVDPEFDFASADYKYVSDYFSGPTRMWQSVIRVSEMFYWMCGKSDEFRVVGGSGWPFSASDPTSMAKRQAG